MERDRLFLFGGMFILVAAGMFSLTHVAGNKMPATALLALTEAADASASPSSNISSTTIITALGQLQQGEQSLASSLNAVHAELRVFEIKNTFPRTLKSGDSGDDVKALQTMLATSTASSTPSGKYDKATMQQVKDFQTQAGIKATGTFDAATRDALAASVAKRDTASVLLPEIALNSLSDPSGPIADLQAQVSQLTSDVSSAQDSVDNLQSSIDTLQSQLGLITSTPAPVQTQTLAIGNIAATTTKTSATVTWTTNNPATSEVDYSTNSSMPVTSTSVASSTALVTNHSLTLSGLSTNTAYYYHIVSKDSAGTIANSTNLSFTPH